VDSSDTSTIGLIAADGREGHGRDVHSPRCLPSHLLHSGKAVESRHIPVLMLLDPLRGNNACITVGVVLMPTVPTLEPLLSAIRSFSVSA